MTSPDPGLPDEPAAPEPGPAAPALVRATVTGRALAGGPVLAEQSREDTDAAWGEYPDAGDDRLYRERPPHWVDF